MAARRSPGGLRAQLAHHQAPRGERRAPWTTRAIERWLYWNEAILSRFGPRETWDLDPGRSRPWARDLQDGWKTIRKELDANRAAGVTIPLMGQNFQIDPADVGAAPDVQLHPDGWRAYVLRTFDGPIPSAMARYPGTVELLSRVPGLTLAELSCMEPGGVIPAHRAPNKGSLRYLLAIEVPDPPGSCGLRIADHVVEWTEGTAVLFDHSIDHEAWNRGDGDRVLLFLELHQPMRAPLSWLNSLSQRIYAQYPGLRGSRARIQELDQAINP